MKPISETYMPTDLVNVPITINLMLIFIYLFGGALAFTHVIFILTLVFCKLPLKMICDGNSNLSNCNHVCRSLQSVYSFFYLFGSGKTGGHLDHPFTFVS